MEINRVKSHAFSLENKGLLRSSKPGELLRELLFGVLLLTFIGIVFLGVNLLVQEHLNSSPNIAEIQSVFTNYENNIKLQPFEHIQTVPYNAQCPAGYSPISIGHFNGTKVGCVCSDGSKKELSRNKCNDYAESKIECVYKEATSPRDFFVWITMKFCGKFYESMRFIEEGGNCANLGMNECQKELCIKGTTCPVTSLEVKRKEAANFVQTSFFQDSQPFGVGHDIYLSRDKNSQPIVGFDSQLSFAPCLADTIANPFTKSLKSYPLDVIPANGCGQFLESQEISTWLGKYDQTMFYKENDFESRLNDMPFKSTFYDEIDYTLLYSTTRFISKNSKACQSLPLSGIQEMSNSHSQLKTQIFGITIALIVVAAIGLLLSIVLWSFRTKFFGLNKRDIVIVIAILVLAAILSIVLYWTVLHNSSSDKINKTSSSFQEFISKNCVKSFGLNKAASLVTNGYSSSLHKWIWTANALFWLALSSLLLLLLILGLRRLKKNDLIPDPSI